MISRMTMKYLLVFTSLLVGATGEPPTEPPIDGVSAPSDGLISVESLAQEWVDRYNYVSEDVTFAYVTASWAYNTNLTQHNADKLVEARLASAAFSQEAYNEASKFAWRNFEDQNITRLFGKITDIGTAVLEGEDLERLSEVDNELAQIYSTAEVCNDTGCYTLNPDLYRIMANSRDWDELKWVWKEWRNESGRKMKDKYEEFVGLQNKAAVANLYEDTGDYWRSWYETETFEADCLSLWEEVKPLYQHLHAYVKRKLKQQYASHAQDFPSSGHIPAHILGNMWSQTWGNIRDIVNPYPAYDPIDVSPTLQAQGYNATGLFLLSEEFFTSLGLLPMPQEFWDHSMIEKPTDGRDVVCHASAWDFYNRKDVRIKQCTEISQGWLETTHHEMGHVQYYLQYKNQHIRYRRGANPGFHEAVGDVLSLSVSTPEHLNEIGLLDVISENEEYDINFLMSQALDKIAFLPFGYLIDQWRWSVFRGETTKEEYNDKWWELRCKHQGISPPVARGEDDFDPGAKFHIPNNTPYIRYFISFIIQFQFHKALCEAAGQTGPLHRCDIYRSQAAGTKLGDMLALGSSKPWPDAMEAITGQREMSASALIEYFQPLLEWLQEQNKGHDITWPDGCPPAPGELPPDEMEAYDWLQEYNDMAEKEYYDYSVAHWNYNTNLTDHNSAKAVAASIQVAGFAQEMYTNATKFDWKNFENEEIKRLFSKVTRIGMAVLEGDDLLQLNELSAEREKIYSTAKVCNTTACYPLTPDLSQIMASSRDWDELKWVWDEWRKESGSKMTDVYEEFVALQNKAAVMNEYDDTGDYWRSWYETETFEADCLSLFEEVKPLYQQLHAYVKRKLKQQYSSNTKDFPNSGHIPAHILGNMWSQTWSNILDLVNPYPDFDPIDVTSALKERNHNVTSLFLLSEEFFTSLGLLPMTEEFWNNSMIVKPPDREVVCHASAWDFSNKKDFRIKQCTEMTHSWLDTTHHEMGQIAYFQQYRNQHIEYRGGANPGFHGAVGDVMSLSVATQEHLYEIGLLEEISSDEKYDINYLMSMALDKLAFLPFGYLIDQWRWSVFKGETTPDKYNDKWWELRCKHQGISPPVTRPADAFDPGAKYHITGNTPYIRYFVSYIIQFQFHKALCEAAGQTGPLHRCDIYRSKEAGKKLGDMLALGSSKPWPDAMEAITGQREMSAAPLIEYFQPLLTWLEKENEGHEVTWEDACPTSPTSPPDPSLAVTNVGSFICIVVAVASVWFTRLY